VSHVVEPDASDRAAPAPGDPIDRLARAIALAGGLLSLGVAVLVTASILSRRFLGQPVPGDFEFVQMVTAVAVFAFLPLCQAHRGNIVVDTFTNRLSLRGRNRLDALWDLVYAAFAGLISVGLFKGASEAAAYGTTTMVLGLPIWPAIAVSALLCAVLSGVSIATALRLLRSRP
jgi:TRAP-type C4-dicarboxylate transport system permease small subunit